MLKILKIKENVDLKELEKFGFTDLEACYKKIKLLGAQYFIFVDKQTKKITRLHPYSLREEVVEEEIQDLIQAGLVEEVKEKLWYLKY